MWRPETSRAISRRLLARVVATTDLSDLSPGSETLQIIEALADELWRLGRGVYRLRDSRLLARMSYEDLILFARELLPEPLLPDPGQRSSCWGTFSRSTTTGELVVPPPFLVTRDDGRVYQSISTFTVPDGATDSASVQVVAQKVGIDGNASVGAIRRVVSLSPPGLEFVNTTAAADGLDLEAQEDFLARVGRHLRTLGRCTRLAILERLLQVELDGRAVRHASAFPGARPAQAIVFIDDGTGELYNALKSGPATVLASPTVEGERYFQIPHFPLLSQPMIVATSSIGTVWGTDPFVHLGTGEVDLGFSTADGMTITVHPYTYWKGLVAAASNAIYGDPTDPSSPPAVALGTEVLVQGARAYYATIRYTLIVQSGYAWADVAAAVNAALLGYVNALPIGRPLYRGQVWRVIMNTPGVLTAEVAEPAKDLYRPSDTGIRLVPDDLFPS